MTVSLLEAVLAKGALTGVWVIHDLRGFPFSWPYEREQPWTELKPDEPIANLPDGQGLNSDAGKRPTH